MKMLHSDRSSQNFGPPQSVEEFMINGLCSWAAAFAVALVALALAMAPAAHAQGKWRTGARLFRKARTR